MTWREFFWHFIHLQFLLNRARDNQSEGGGGGREVEEISLINMIKHWLSTSKGWNEHTPAQAAASESDTSIWVITERRVHINIIIMTLWLHCHPTSEWNRGQIEWQLIWIEYAEFRPQRSGHSGEGAAIGQTKRSCSEGRSRPWHPGSILRSISFIKPDGTEGELLARGESIITHSHYTLLHGVSADNSKTS